MPSMEAAGIEPAQDSPGERHLHRVSVPAAWTKHRPIAYGIAADYRIPGMGRDDVRQEALIALWEAVRAHDPVRGPFPPFARLVITRHLTDLLRTATRAKRGTTVELPDDIASPDRTDGQEALAEIRRRLPTLTPLEREAVAAQLDGSYQSANRRHENALQAARRKLTA